MSFKKYLKNYAKVTEEDLNRWANTLNIDLKDEHTNTKDNENYNFYLFSKYLDSGALAFSEVGQSDVHNQGKLMELDGFIRSKDKALVELINLQEGHSDYAPIYDSLVSGELRTKFLLQTEDKDEYSTMMDFVLSKMKTLMSEYEYDLLIKIMNKSKERIFKEQLLFLEPKDGYELGVHRELTKEEKEKYNYNVDKTIMVDERSDSDDFLALKDLYLLFRGFKKWDEFIIGPGFFNKYMKEFGEKEADSLVFKVVKGELTEIKIIGQDDSYHIPYSPVRATSLLFKEYGITFTSLDEFESIKGILDEDTKYYVVVDGAVAAPSGETAIDYEFLSINDRKIKAGETFLIEQVKGTPKVTRLYFTPYKPSEVHPHHQHGSVIFGTNTQMYHSVFDGTGDEVEIKMSALFMNYMKMRNKENPKGPVYQDASFAAARKHFLPKDTSPLILLKEENIDTQTKANHSYFDVTDFTTYYTFFLMRNNSSLMYDLKIFKELDKVLMGNYATLPKRFDLKEYLLHGTIISEEINGIYEILGEQQVVLDQISVVKALEELQGKLDE